VKTVRRALHAAEALLLEDRMEFLLQHHTTKQPLTTNHDPNAEHKITAAPGSEQHKAQTAKVLQHWASADPTQNKQYTGRVVHWYSQHGEGKNELRQEDHPRVTQALHDFHAMKSKMPEKDINRYTDLQHLENEVDKVKAAHGGAAPTSNRQVAKSADDQALDNHTKLLHKSENSTVRQINSGGHAGMSVLARNSRWCVSNEGTFESYAKRGPLYWIHHKPSNKKYLYHPQSDQLMKEDDTRADHNQMAKDMPELRDVLHGKGHHFTDPVRFHKSLQNGEHTEPSVREWMARNTDHQPLLVHLLKDHTSEVLGNKHFKSWDHVRGIMNIAKEMKTPKKPPQQ
jgi:hypothetical protein